MRSHVDGTRLNYLAATNAFGEQLLTAWQYPVVTRAASLMFVYVVGAPTWRLQSSSLRSSALEQFTWSSFGGTALRIAVSNDVLEKEPNERMNEMEWNRIKGSRRLISAGRLRP